MPLMALTATVPPSDPLPGLAAMESVTVLVAEVWILLFVSSIATVIEGAMETPTALLDGCVVKTSCVAELEVKVGEPFEHEAKLKSLSQRQEEIMKSLDLNRNQASNQLATTSPTDMEENTVETMSSKMRNRLHQGVRTGVK